MERLIEIFTTLGKILSRFGTDESTRDIEAAACRANGWFTPSDIRRSIRAIVSEMLQREALEMWLRRYPTLPLTSPRRVLVIMAGNIPLVGFFDLLCTVISGHHCMVKCSAKDSVLMRYVVEQLLAIEPAIGVEFYESGTSIEAVIATGSDNANRYFKAKYGAFPSLFRGSRQSVAVLTGRETAGQLDALSDDIWAYNGLGCRNVSLLFVPKGYCPQLQLPCLNPRYLNNYRQNRALLQMQGTSFVDLHGALLVEGRQFPLSLSQITCFPYDSIDEVRDWLNEHDEEIQCVVGEDASIHSRHAAFGHAQLPALTDYPDARDVMSWLSALS